MFSFGSQNTHSFLTSSFPTTISVFVIQLFTFFFELIYITHSLPGVWERFFDSLWVDQRQLLSLFVVSSKRGGTERVQTLSHFAHSESQLAKGTEPSRDSSRPSLAMFAIIF